jgi:hypothetical protein
MQGPAIVAQLSLASLLYEIRAIAWQELVLTKPCWRIVCA